MISNGNTADVEVETSDGSGSGLDEVFVANPGVDEPTIIYKIKSNNDGVKFVRVSMKVENVKTVKVFVLDQNMNEVAPINPKKVNKVIFYIRVVSDEHITIVQSIQKINNF